LNKHTTLIGCGIPEIKEANGKLIAEGRCIREGDAVYCKDLYEYECIVAGKIRSLLSRQIEVKADLESMINEVEERDGIQYAPEQREAVKMSLVNPVSIITGGPGTGKSTVMNAVVSIYRKLHPDGYIHLAAPTGRAAKRISETTGRTAKTIHRLLQYNPQYGGFQFNADNPLYGPGLLIVDESSMIDIELMAHLITAVYDLQVILVGDVDQLPSVGPGSVLRDCIASGKVPTVRLKYNYRQAGGSKIAEYANVICQGITPPLRSEGDFEFIPIDDADHAVEVILDMVRTAIDLGYGQMDFQVLAPMRRGSCGVAALNDKVRELVNPASPEKPEFGGFRCEDKVMVIKNDYNLGVFNGDLGEIINIEKGTLTIDFGDGIANFRQEDLGILTLAYASTIHKSQGSEFPVVIMPMTRQHYIMLQRNLLYTGMTRAKKRLILVADEWSVKKAVGNNVIEERFSMLAERIRKE
jgi:exodeoxyribonuclease V alpha subunit